MDKVIQFPVTPKGNEAKGGDKDEDIIIWVCNCGCSSFRILGDGGLECANCDQPAIGMPGQWHIQTPKPPEAGENLPDITGKVRVIEYNDGSEFGYRSIMKQAEEWRSIGQLSAVIISRFGKVESFCMFPDDEVRDQTLDNIKQHLENINPKGDREE